MQRVLYTLILYLVSLSLLAKPSFEVYLQQLQDDPYFSEFSKEFLQSTFKEIQYISRVVALDKKQPELIQTVDSYLKRALPKWKVDKARQLYKEHGVLLHQIGQKYRVQPRFIVALWGIESNFGAYMGSYSVLSSLATLAYDGRREDFFKRQLHQALKIVDEGHISPKNFLGSWAGAFGQVQFMPSSFLSYAVDHDGNNKKDLWQSLPDIFASAAHYLHQNGWEYSQTWARQVSLPENIDQKVLGLSVKKPLAHWQELGVRRFNGGNLPIRDLRASLIIPDGPKGRAYLVYGNYHTLKHWNRSTHFVVSVGSLADRIVWPKPKL